MYFEMTLDKRAESEQEGRIYDAFSRHYDLFQGELSKITWDQGIVSEIQATLRKEGRVFDAGAGTGIGARCLKAVGHFHITSCDQNRLMLAQAKDVSDEILQADLSCLPTLPVKFDFIVSGNDALNYLKPDDLGHFFCWSRQHLAKDGCLVFDYSSPKLIRDSWRSKKWKDIIGELTLAYESHYDESLQRAEIELTCLCNGVVLWAETHQQYALDTFDIYILARANGLEVQRVRNLADSNFTPESLTHLYVLTHRKK